MKGEDPSSDCKNGHGLLLHSDQAFYTLGERVR